MYPLRTKSINPSANNFPCLNQRELINVEPEEENIAILFQIGRNLIDYIANIYIKEDTVWRDFVRYFVQHDTENRFFAYIYEVGRVHAFIHSNSSRVSQQPSLFNDFINTNFCNTELYRATNTSELLTPRRTFLLYSDDFLSNLFSDEDIWEKWQEPYETGYSDGLAEILDCSRI